MLTDRAIKNAKPRKNLYRLRDNHPDPELRGMALRVTPAGTKTFEVHYTSPEDGKRRPLDLGQYPGTSLAVARKRCRAAREQLAQGIDPKLAAERQDEADKAAQQAAENPTDTVGSMFAWYVVSLKERGKRSAVEVERSYRHDVQQHIGNLRAANVTGDDIADLLSLIVVRGSPRMANVCRSYLRAAFSFGLKARRRPEWRARVPDFGLRGNPVDLVDPVEDAERVGTRYLDEAEIKKIWTAPPGELAVEIRLAICWLLACGSRVEEGLGATWAEIDTERGEWVIPGSRRKNGVEHMVPLTGFHLELLEKIKAISGYQTFLFPGRPETVARSSNALQQGVARYRKRVGMERWSPRDIRRTVKTLGGKAGISLEDRNRLQGHALTDVGSKHYDRYSYAIEKRRAMEVWAGYLERIIDGTSADVIEIRRQSR